MSKIELTELYKKQATLDECINKNHNVNYQNTKEKRILALLVEIGEFANSTRCFKYWSNKKSEDLAIVLDEYADGLHFFLSLGILINNKKVSFNYTKHETNLTDQILKTYYLTSVFYKKQDEKSYIKAFQSFLNIVPLLKVRWNTIKKAYLKKLDENFLRQANNY